MARLLRPHNRASSPRFLRLARATASVMATSKRRDQRAANGATHSDGVMLKQALAELRPAMFALAYRITGNRADAEEIVQDAFVRLHDSEPREAVQIGRA